MGKAPAFQLYAADFYMDTLDWTPVQVGVYMRLLMSEWVNGPLSNNISDLARIGGIDPRTMAKIWTTKLEKKFQPDGAGMLINKRLEEVRQKQNKYRESQVKKGRAGAKTRWGT